MTAVPTPTPSPGGATRPQRDPVVAHLVGFVLTAVATVVVLVVALAHTFALTYCDGPAPTAAEVWDVRFRLLAAVIVWGVVATGTAVVVRRRGGRSLAWWIVAATGVGVGAVGVANTGPTFWCLY